MQTGIDKQGFCQRVVESASIRLDKVAMRLIEPAGEESITFGSMLSQIRSIAYRLQQEQIAFGDRVAILGENHPHWAIAYLGILYRGAVVTPLDPAAETSALAAFLKDSEAKLAFVSPASMDKFRSACQQLGLQIAAVSLLTSPQTDGIAPFADWASTSTPSGFDPDTHLLRAMRASAAALREGKILNIYPEGQRTFDGQLQEFKKGAAILATELAIPIVPVAIDGPYRIWPRESWRIRLAKVKISFGEPLDQDGVAADKDSAYDKTIATTKERIHLMLDRMRATTK